MYKRKGKDNEICGEINCTADGQDKGCRGMTVDKDKSNDGRIDARVIRNRAGR